MLETCLVTYFCVCCPWLLLLTSSLSYLMASPTFWMLSKKKKYLRITPLFISCPFITSIRKFSRCYFQKTSKIQLLPALSVTALNQISNSSSLLLTAASLSPCCLLLEQQPQGHIIHVTPLLKTLLPTSFMVKAKVPTVAYWSVPPLNIILAIFSLTLFQLHLPPGYSLNMPGKLPLPSLCMNCPSG